MANFNRGGQGRGRSFGNNRDFTNRGSARPTLYKAVCSKCGKDCEVPFRPSGDKPVFCRDCFRENGGADARRSDERSVRPVFDNRSTENAYNKEQFIALNTKLDRILHILESAISPKEEVVTPAEAVIPEKKKRVAKKAL